MKRLKDNVNKGILANLEQFWLEPISTCLQPYYGFIEEKIELPNDEYIDSSNDISVFNLYSLYLQFKSMSDFNGEISKDLLKQLFQLKEVIFF